MVWTGLRVAVGPEREEPVGRDEAERGDLVLLRLGDRAVAEGKPAQGHRQRVGVVQFDEVVGETDLTAGQPLVDSQGGRLRGGLGTIGQAEGGLGELPLALDDADGEIGGLEPELDAVEQVAAAGEGIVEIERVSRGVQGEAQVQTWRGTVAVGKEGEIAARLENGVPQKDELAGRGGVVTKTHVAQVQGRCAGRGVVEEFDHVGERPGVVDRTDIGGQDLVDLQPGRRGTVHGPDCRGGGFLGLPLPRRVQGDHVDLIRAVGQAGQDDGLLAPGDESARGRGGRRAGDGVVEGVGRHVEDDERAVVGLLGGAVDIDRVAVGIAVAGQGDGGDVAGADDGGYGADRGAGLAPGPAVEAISVAVDVWPADGEGDAVGRGGRVGRAGNGRPGRDDPAGIHAVGPQTDGGRAVAQAEVRPRVGDVGDIDEARVGDHVADPSVRHGLGLDGRVDDGVVDREGQAVACGVGVGEHGGHIVEDVPVGVDVVTLPLARAGLVDVDGGAGGVDDGVVDDRAVAAVLDEDGVVDVVEEVPHDGDLGDHAALGAGGDSVGEALARGVLVDVHEEVALDVGVGGVEVETIVGGGGEYVIEELGDVPGPLAAGEVDDVVAAGGPAEVVAVEEGVPAVGEAPVMDDLRVGDLGQDAVGQADGRIVEGQVLLGVVGEQDVVQHELGVLGLDGLGAGIGVLDVGVRDGVDQRGIGGVGELHAGPVGGSRGGPREANAGQLGPLSVQPPVDDQFRARLEEHGGPGTDGERGAGGDGEVGGHVVRSGLRRPLGIDGDRARDVGERTVVVIHVDVPAIEAAARAVRAVEGLDEDAIDPGREGHAFTGRPRGDGGDQLGVEADVAAVDGVLVDLDGQHVGAVDQEGLVDVEGPVRRLVRSSLADGGQRRVVDRSGGHVGTGDLDAVQIDDRAVVAKEPQGECRHACGIVDVERLAEVGGDELVVRIAPVADGGGLVAVAVAQLPRALGPGGVVESRGPPGRPLVAAVVEVAPGRAGGQERLRTRAVLAERPRAGLGLPDGRPAVYQDRAGGCGVGGAADGSQGVGGGGIAVDDRQGAGDGEVARDLVQHGGAAVGHERLHHVQRRLRDPRAQQPVRHLGKLGRREHRLDQVQQVPVVAADEFGMVEQPGDLRQSVGRLENGLADVGGGLARAQDGVHVVGQEAESRVDQPGEQGVVVSVTVAEVGLLVAQQRLEGEPPQPLLHVDHFGYVLGERGVGRIVEHVGQVDQVGPVVQARVGLLVEAVVDELLRVGAAIGEVRPVGRLGRDRPAAVDVAVGVVGEPGGGEVAVEDLQGHIAAVHPAAGLGQVGPVDPHLHGLGVGGGQAGQAEQGAAQGLEVRIAGVEIDGRHVLPGPVVDEVDAIVVGRAEARAVAAVSDADVVADLNARAVDADERAVHLGVAAGLVPPRVADLGQFGSLRRGHDQPVDRLTARRPLGRGVEGIVHLVEQAWQGLAAPRAGRLDRSGLRGRPGARQPAFVGRPNVELHDGAVGLGGELRPPDAVARLAVPVQAVVPHRDGGKARRAVQSIQRPDSQPAGLLVDHPGRYGYRLQGRRDRRVMRHVAHQRGEVTRRDRVRLPRRALIDRAGGPVLPAVVGQERVDQLQRLAPAGVAGRPDPAVVDLRGRAGRVGGSGLPLGPVALVGEADTVDQHSAGVAKFDLLPLVAEHPRPAAHDVAHAGVLGREGRRIGGQHEVPASRDAHVAEGVVHALGNPPAGDVHGGAAAVVQLDVLLQRVLAGRVIHDLADHDLTREVGHLLRGVQQARRGRQEVTLSRVVQAQAVGHIRCLRGELGRELLLDRRAVRADQGQVLPARVELEVGVQLAGQAILLGGEDHHALSRGERQRRESPFDEVGSLVGQVPTGQLHDLRGRVVDLDPVAAVPVLIGQGMRVGGHELGDQWPIGEKETGLESLKRPEDDHTFTSAFTDLPHRAWTSILLARPQHRLRVPRCEINPLVRGPGSAEEP
ncbi:MAG: hypothetical protein BWX88_04885 [Planctomycetes bacterium ADurb.Bin126]|nr:MAG: hypothetical protein BWX88_04885 [Planctomycetes bacterium ADurb.Bin126]